MSQTHDGEENSFPRSRVVESHERYSATVASIGCLRGKG